MIITKFLVFKKLINPQIIILKGHDQWRGPGL
jgi:hypothetical protein